MPPTTHLATGETPRRYNNDRAKKTSERAGSQIGAMDTRFASPLVHSRLVIDDLARIVGGSQPPYDDSDDDNGTPPLLETPRATAAPTPAPRSTVRAERVAKKARVVKEKRRRGEMNKVGLPATAGGDAAGLEEGRDERNEIASLKKELARKDRELERRKDEAKLLRLKLEGVRKVVGSPLRCIYSQD